MNTTIRLALSLLIVLPLIVPGTVRSDSICDPDGVQDSGSIYRICMPPENEYNGDLVIWAHGFQDAGTPVEIPENQLCIDGFCIPELINGLGFGFATNSYSKTGLAIRQGIDDIVDLVDIFAAEKGTPARVYLVGASEGGIITALLVEGRPDVFDAGVAACGPVGDFPFQINYFGNGRALFQYFFPGLIPGDPFDPAPLLVENWSAYYEEVVRPVVIHPSNRDRLDQLVVVAKLPFDPDNYLETAEQSVRDVLRYSVVNLKDASETLGGFPFDNRNRIYRGSDNDLRLNLLVPRVDADPEAITEMETFYNTSGILQQQLVTMHTRLDQQVPYLHEPFYILKTIASGSFIVRHANVPIDRYGHCNFTPGELVFSFALMLVYDGNLVELSGVGSLLKGDDLESFQQRAAANSVPYRLEGERLGVELRE